MNTTVPSRRRRPAAAAHVVRRGRVASPPAAAAGTPLVLCFLPEAEVAVVLTAFCQRLAPSAPADDDDPLS